MNQRVARAIAKELLVIQAGSVDDAIALFDDGGGWFTEEEQAEVLEMIEEEGNTELQAET